MDYNYLLKIAYDGTDYYGWQKTKSGPSIEEELEKALFTILQKKISLQAASRTDKGVHAEGQIINFFSKTELGCNKTLYSLNRLLPKDIRILEMKKASISFHPTLDAYLKTYHYRVCIDKILLPHQRHTFWHYTYPIDLSLIQDQLINLIGEKDFTSFANKKYENALCLLKNIEIQKIEKNTLLIIISGNRFLYNMARILTGTILQIASKKISYSLKQILEKKNRKYAGITAPSLGLILKSVEYQVV